LKIPFKVAGYKLSRSLKLRPPLPINVTVSLTNTCNSRCKTCFIWRHYREHPEQREREFETWEFDRTFQNLSKNPVWFTFSGGEPYLRSDIVEICASACEHCSPQVITIPTNALLPSLIEEKNRGILERCGDVRLIVNVSLDGIGEKHDEIRGVERNFDRVLDTLKRLKGLKEEFPNLNLGIHSVISRYNVDQVLKLYEYVKTLNPDSYISEIAENRTELFNMDHDIAPDPHLYAETISMISDKIRSEGLETRGFTSRVIQSFRTLYYDLVIQEMEEKRQVIPCYAGYASCQITPNGDVWPCCVLGYDKPMGNLRQVEYDFKKVWFSREADEIRNYISGGKCYCPLANAHYTNILCSLQRMMRVMRAIF